ncbi:MAG: DUF2309 family protein [Myxococcales bacterium]|nr:DUF2309 family protein [Myxococcales bacterium]USN49804.1 MAG: DUF2309 family protein [Myxococcales bacterium]
MNRHNHKVEYCLLCEVQKLEKLLPVQGPIKDFVHQNILLAYLGQPFDEAVLSASEILQSRYFMDFNYYRSKFQEKVIDYKCLKRSLEIHLPQEQHSDLEIFERALFDYVPVSDMKTLNFLAKRNAIKNSDIKKIMTEVSNTKNHFRKNTKVIRNLIIEQVGVNFDHEIHQLLIRLLGSFVDQGVSLWPYINNAPSFVEAIKNLAESSELPLKPWINNKELAEWLSMPSQQAITAMLSKIVRDNKLYTPYLQESLLTHPGWSGMVNVISKNPEALSHPCSIDLVQLLHVKIAFEYQYLKRYEKFDPIDYDCYQATREIPHHWDMTDIYSTTWFLCNIGKKISTESIGYINDYFLKKIWHRALENTYYKDVSLILSSSTSATSDRSIKKFQAVFCIDDRECSFRRILEFESDDVETFGTPGFYGIDSFFQANEGLVQKICPPAITPSYIIRETSENSNEKSPISNLVELTIFMARHGANSTLLGFLSACTFGHLSLFRLLSSFLRPLKWQKSYQLNKEKQLACPIYERDENSALINGLKPGYTIDEMALRVYSTLKNMGLCNNFSPLVVMFGHGSSSVNNPHFAAYDCGACSSKPGNNNARIFATMANRNDVRALVDKKGITIPQTTHFLGAYHDTCNDRVEFFDLDKIPNDKQQLFQEFSQHVFNTSRKNAKERCERFALVPKNIKPEQALREVYHRSRALFEPRSELGHASNALLVVGRRERSKKIDLQRRALLQSYDPTSDQQGTILSSILTAAIPVSAGINLDYYFSRLDPAIYGCGSKLSHNVMSLIGVGNGLDDDLRTGIPIQMTELHDPIRLLVVIEQYESIIEQAIYDNPAVRPWIENSWTRLASLHPQKNTLTLFSPDQHSWHSFDDLVTT